MASQLNIGFRDRRTDAELLLTPRLPASRNLTASASLRLGLGGIPTPGVISDAVQITGPIRKVYIDALQARARVQDTIKGIQDALTGNVSIFLDFSDLRPGQTPPASFQVRIQNRQTQLQGILKSLKSSVGRQKSSGVSVQEDTAPTAYPRAEQLNAPSIPRLARGGAAAQSDPILKDKIRFVVKGVAVATGKPSFWSRLISAAAVAALPGLNPVVNQTFKDRKNSSAWSEPVTAYNAQYPYNKVQQTESGHVIELDDTPGAERVHIFHRSGSFIEWHPNGTVVYKNMSDAYAITMGDQFVNVKGKCHVNVEGGATIFVKGNVDIQSDGDVNVQAKKDFNVYAENINLRAKKTARLDGKDIDLRYIKLPKQVAMHYNKVPITAPPGYVMVPSGKFLPTISMAALVSDFPSFTPDAPELVPQSVVVPPANPLSNPAAYVVQTPAAVNYRTRLFDTPEEVSDFDSYSSHLGLQQALGDVPVGTDPTLLPGKLRTGTSSVPDATTPATITQLNFDDYKGIYEYPDTYVLANTSFTLADLIDIGIHPDIVTPLEVPEFMSTVDAPSGGSGPDPTDPDAPDTPHPPTANNTVMT